MLYDTLYLYATGFDPLFSWDSVRQYNREINATKPDQLDGLLHLKDHFSACVTAFRSLQCDMPAFALGELCIHAPAKPFVEYRVPIAP